MKHHLQTVSPDVSAWRGFRSYQYFLLFFAMTLFWNDGYAADISSISGEISDGQNITITGSGFGAGPNVVVFDDFESGVPQTNIRTGTGSAKYGKWDGRDSTGSSYYGTAASLSGAQSFSTDYSVHYANWIQANLPANTRDVFVSWWLYLPASSPYPGETGPNGTNWKQMWIQGSSTSDDDLVVPTRLANGWIVNGNDGNPGYSNYTDLGFNKGEWKRIWTWLKGSTSSSSNDGEFKLWTLDSSGVNQRENDIGINNLKASGAWEKVRPNGYGRLAANCITSYDDIYIASGPNAQARVEIGSSPVYANATKLTILTPTNWTNNSISATVNHGSFNNGQTAYLFVVDANGNSSSGFPVTMGSGSGTPGNAAPNPPSGIQ